jgi:hypothetical protein
VRFAAYAILLVLVAAAVTVGHIGVALAIAGLKAVIVGLEFMELRQAARQHMLGFVAWSLAVTALLVALT